MSDTPCPSRRDLAGLLEGELPSDAATGLTDHVGACVGCQEQLEGLACDDPHFSAVVRHIDADLPPSHSAYWKALDAVQADGTKTALFAAHPAAGRTGFVNGFRDGADGHPSGELKLDFLQPAERPGDLGRLGTFHVAGVVGRGGMGVVLHAFDPCLERDVAIKVLDPQLAGNETARARFCREARAAAAVSHENIVAVHQVDEDPISGLPYMVMQLVSGESLEQRLKRVGRLGISEVARLGMQAAAGLAAAHASGLIHRDVKPGNILMEAGTDRVKLTDFGLARAAEDVKLTRTGFVAGTPLYMAPEQARGDDVDARADLFSLGTVLYEAAAGKPPFEGKTPLAVLRRVADEAHAPLEEATADAPAWLSIAVDRLLEKDPVDRFQTASEVAELFALEVARAQALSPLAVPSDVCGLSRASGVRRRRGVHWGCVARLTLPWAGGILIGAFLAGVWPGTGGPQPPPAAPTAAPVPAEEPGPPPTALLAGKAGPVWAVGLTPDGQSLVMGIENGTVKLWDLKEKTVRKTFSKLGGTVWSTDVSKDGARMVTASDNSEVTVWNLKTYAEEQRIPLPTSTKSAAFSPDGKKVAVGDRGATVWLWDLDAQTPQKFEGHTGTVHGLAFSPDGQRLASASGDGTVKIWNPAAETGKPIRSLDEHNSPVYGVAYSPDGNKLASAGWDGTVRLWDAQNGAQLHVLKGHSSDVWSVSFSADGELLASAGWDGTVRVWDVAAGRETAVLRDGGVPFHAVRFAREGRRLAVGGRDGMARVWDLAK